MRKKKGRKISGWVLLNKPYTMTSTQAVSKIKYLFEAEKAGHAGTLDPLATGMLPIALGEATKTVPYVMDGKKKYQFTINWGEERTTDDLEGEIQNKSNILPNKKDILKILPNYVGTIQQRPPKFSAIKINGQRAYDLARSNIDIELKTRDVTIYNLSLIEHAENNSYSIFTIECGKGTYIRSLARDLGHSLATYGYVAKLHRIFVNPFQNASMLDLDDIIKNKENDENLENIDSLILPLEEVLKSFNNYELDLNQFQKIQNGNSVFLFNINSEKQTDVSSVSYNKRIIALGILEKNLFKPKRVFQL